MTNEYGIIAGIDVHKMWLYIAVGNKEGNEYQRHRCGTRTVELAALADWLNEQQVTTVVMESTAQYWKPVWLALEGRFRLLLAQAESNAARPGRKMDYWDAERLVRRLHARDLVLSFVPDAEQRQWRMLTRNRVEYGRQIGQVRNHVETLLEECRIKISGYLSDLFGTSGMRILNALASGERNVEKLAALRSGPIKATRQEMEEALNGEMSGMQQLVLRQMLEQVAQLNKHVEELSVCITGQLEQHADAVRRLCEIPGVGVVAAQQIIAELGSEAATFPTSDQVSSWVGVSPGKRKTAGKSKSNKSPQGNRQMRRILTQCAWAGVRTKGTALSERFHRMVPRMGAGKAIWAAAHRLLEVIWIVLHRHESYKEFGATRSPLAAAKRLAKLTREIQKLGYQVSAVPV